MRAKRVVTVPLQPYFGFLGWPRSTGPQSNQSYERENPSNRTFEGRFNRTLGAPKASPKYCQPSVSKQQKLWEQSGLEPYSCNRTLGSTEFHWNSSEQLLHKHLCANFIVEKLLSSLGRLLFGRLKIASQSGKSKRGGGGLSKRGPDRPWKGPNLGKRSIKANGLFLGTPVGRKTAPLKRPIRRSMMQIFSFFFCKSYFCQRLS